MINSITSFKSCLAERGIAITRRPLEILQINLGKLCNQACHHCHVEAGPKRTEIMEKKTMDHLLRLLDQTSSINTVDLTGGAPELNPHFRYLITELHRRKKTIIDRCNLTVLFEKGQEETAYFLKEYRVNVTASLPCYSKKNVDAQRGNGVFEKSVRALRLLNELGYGKRDSGLLLNLVYNPSGAFLPPTQEKLEIDYKKELRELFGIEFNRLFTITNMPIKRFLDQLVREHKYEDYMTVLANSFNVNAAENVMCRNLISVGWDGIIYDTVLDLGCGSGRDCYLFSKLVGPNGSVIGIDMTDEQLAVARTHQNYHAKVFEQQNSNVRFIKGFIEDLEGAGIKSQSIDVVTSNCVINLSPNKERVFAEIFRVLKPGGELFFSDVFASRRLPEGLKQYPTLVGECLGGALYTEDFRRLLSKLGCADFRILTQNKIDIPDPDVAKQTGQIEFYSQTIRAFKLPLEDRCEDYGQAAVYLGGVPYSENVFILDDHHSFEKGKFVSMCSNTADMLGKTRYAQYFKIIGDASIHFGLFDCNKELFSIHETASTQACC